MRVGHVRSWPLPGRLGSGTLALGQGQWRRRLPETAPSPAPRPPAGRPTARPTARRAGPAGSVSTAHTGSARERERRPARPPSPARRRLWLSQGGAHFSKNLLYRVGVALGC